jgi:CHAD domain-containing protein
MTLLAQPIRGLTKDLSRTFSKLADGATPKKIHRLRTTIRRIESVVGYAHVELGKKLEHSLDTLEMLRKRAGKVRNIDVQRKLLEKIGNGSTAGDRKILCEVLQKKREKQVDRLNSLLTKYRDGKLLSRIDRMAEKISQGDAGANRLAPLEEARLQIAKMADHFSAQSIKPNRLHKARIQLKKIRYVAELAQESPEGKVFVEEIKTVQDTLGEWHDWEELTRLAEKHFAQRANCALLREVRALFAARQSAAVSALSRLLAPASAPVPKKAPGTAQPLQMPARRTG